jgi:hypothetical protein
MVWKYWELRVVRVITYWAQRLMLWTDPIHGYPEANPLGPIATA